LLMCKVGEAKDLQAGELEYAMCLNTALLDAPPLKPQGV
jgi:hypothetical protein